MNPPHTAKLRSLKEVQKDKIAPASVGRFALTAPDWGSKDAVQTAKPKRDYESYGSNRHV